MREKARGCQAGAALCRPRIAHGGRAPQCEPPRSGAFSRGAGGHRCPGLPASCAGRSSTGRMREEWNGKCVGSVDRWVAGSVGR